MRVLDPREGETLSILELEEDEAAHSCVVIKFARNPDEKEPEYGEELLLVSTTQSMDLSKPSQAQGFIRCYQFINDGTQLQLLHKTAVEGPVVAMAGYRGRLLAGVGTRLRLYELGKRKLLRKTENKTFSTGIQSIDVRGQRIYVADRCESVCMATYDIKAKTLEVRVVRAWRGVPVGAIYVCLPAFFITFVCRKKNHKRTYISILYIPFFHCFSVALFQVFVDASEPRHMTACCVVDYDTLAGADKFGNFFLSRMPDGLDEDIAKDITGGKGGMRGMYGKSMMGRTQHKLTEVSRTHVGEIITKMEKCALVPGGTEVILYSTIMGGLGCMIPLTSREDVEFFTHLEMHMRIEEPPLSGRVSPPPHALGSQCLVPPPFFGLFLGFFWLAFPFVCSCCLPPSFTRTT